jgi:hypothetical protein
MIGAKEKEKPFDGVFSRNQNHSEEWGALAWTLRTAADVLLAAYRDTWEPGGEPLHPENEHLDSPATMLYGCAMENAIKGCLIKKHGSFEEARAANQTAWHRHQISSLAVATVREPTS